MATAEKVTRAPIDRVSIARIEVPRERLRDKLGSVVALKRSIDELGLIHPVLLTERDQLIAGARRLRACDLLGWKSIPARRVSNLSPEERVDIERDENEHRDDPPAYSLAAPRHREVVAYFQRLFTEEKQALRQKGSSAAAVVSPTRQQQLMGKARAKVGVSQRTAHTDKRIVGIIDKYPEFTEWGQRPLLLLDEWMEGLPVTERRPARALLVSFPRRQALTAVNQFAKIVDWQPGDRATLWAKVRKGMGRDGDAKELEEAQSAMFEVPPTPEPELAKLGVLIDDLGDMIKSYKRRDYAAKCMRNGLENLKAAEGFLRDAYAEKRREFAHVIDYDA